MMADFVQIVTTLPSRAEADRLARVLVERRLAACVQVSGPIASTYRWQGAIEAGEEWVCTAKCRAGRFDDVAAVISSLHPYETPEVLATPIVAAAPRYLTWLDAELA